MEIRILWSETLKKFIEIYHGSEKNESNVNLTQARAELYESNKYRNDYYCIIILRCEFFFLPSNRHRQRAQKLNKRQREIYIYYNSRNEIWVVDQESSKVKEVNTLAKSTISTTHSSAISEPSASFIFFLWVFCIFCTLRFLCDVYQSGGKYTQQIIMYMKCNKIIEEETNPRPRVKRKKKEFAGQLSISVLASYSNKL